ncbi:MULTISPECIES: DUF2252 domain-containing protein [unclassified Arthrobacter]|uniref:DUF2252 domain-containing protein n=1 Tax=unclassified Arthrobacter TaxID=235627 RepID=UPI002E0B1257|nr:MULTISPECIES: DUF2252 domain-containing protein [unclassified Arthrobacter]MEC5190857.1 uncharacterized protein (DUF2252 family) [Arthrobacter sp. MP_M4]MEC5202125.1 uncharacterized protein (DUF2252 family) [Arthrobacter sp. MP_M7]
MKTLPGAAHKDSIARAQAAGRAARDSLPRRRSAALDLPERDPVGILEGQHTGRVPDLIPVRVGRMLESPFSFYRGAAAVMAHDLADAAVTGHTLIASGDAHLANFGLFASPERRVIFDLNDFDEAYPAPWEWDVKRLAASIWLNGRNSSHTEEQCRTAVKSCVRSYRQALKSLYSQTATERYYFQVDAEYLAAQRTAAHKRIRTEEKKARQRTSEQVLAKLTSSTDSGEPRIVDQPPIVRHPQVVNFAAMQNLVELYRNTLRPDTSLLLSQYRLVDLARRIVGVGSVGTRSWVLLFEGPAGEPLFLQAKEAGKSVLETHGRAPQPPELIAQNLITRGQGFRVVGAQRILQAQSDPFLGWIKDVRGEDGLLRDFYIRQFRDMKGSFALAEMNVQETTDYGVLCGFMLARAHSQSANSAFISGYLGGSEVFDEALADWARGYADQTEADHASLAQAVKSGRLPAERGV